MKLVLKPIFPTSCYEKLPWERWKEGYSEYQFSSQDSIMNILLLRFHLSLCFYPPFFITCLHLYLPIDPASFWMHFKVSGRTKSTSLWNCSAFPSIFFMTFWIVQIVNLQIVNTPITQIFCILWFFTIADACAILAFIKIQNITLSQKIPSCLFTVNLHPLPLLFRLSFLTNEICLSWDFI